MHQDSPGALLAERPAQRVTVRAGADEAEANPLLWSARFITTWSEVDIS